MSNKIGQTVGFYYVDKCTVKAYVYNGDKYHPCYNEV